jgi:hypothetical protein
VRISGLAPCTFYLCAFVLLLATVCWAAAIGPSRLDDNLALLAQIPRGGGAVLFLQSQISGLADNGQALVLVGSNGRAALNNLSVGHFAVDLFVDAIGAARAFSDLLNLVSTALLARGVLAGINNICGTVVRRAARALGKVPGEPVTLRAHDLGHGTGATTIHHLAFFAKNAKAFVIRINNRISVLDDDARIVFAVQNRLALAAANIRIVFDPAGACRAHLTRQSGTLVFFGHAFMDSTALAPEHLCLEELAFLARRGRCTILNALDNLS